ncbi:MAG: outer membrane protein assembly factor BamA [bacterium]|nr:outer membrane protein assembly factor BamA [bacterium]
MKRMVLAVALAVAGMASAAKVASVSVKAADGDVEDVGDAAARCQVKVGDEYDPAQCARDVRALRDAGTFDDIVVKAEQGVNGVDVTYVVKHKMRFQGPLAVKGCDYWNEGKIAKFSELKDGYAYGEAEIAAAAGRIRREYQKKFFPDVKVKPVVEPVEGIAGAVKITMEIEEGERAKITDFEFDGNEAFEADELRASFNQYPWWNPMGWFSDVPATPQDLAEARDRVVAFYRDRGYLDVEISQPEVRTREDGERVRVFQVREGPCYKVGTISVTGVKAYPEDVVAAAVKRIAPGDVAGATALDEAAHEIEVFCGSGRAALADTHVTVRRLPSETDPETLNLVFAVEEGVPVTVNRVLIRGNDYTMDKVIRREIALSPGDPMLADKAERSKRRLENLRYFDRVRYYLEKVDGGEAKDGKPELRDLVYELSEKNTGNFLIGIGAGTESSVFGQIELSEANFDLFSPWRFRGAGQKGRLCIQAGPRVQTYEASVTEPWFLDRQLELTVEVYRRQRWYDDYDVIRSGAAVTLSYPVKFWPTWEAFGRLGVSLAAEYIEYDDVDNGYYYDPKRGDRFRMLKEEEDRNGDKVEVPLEVFWKLDTRDRFIFPTQGHTVRLFGDIVGGDNEYWRVGFNVRKYFPVWKKYGHVFQIGLRGETVDAFSDDLPLYDRLFLGGSKSIRGVDFREIAPRIYAHENKKGRYTAWGGQTSWCMNMEYSVPVVKMLRIAAFSDLGSVGEDEFDFDTAWFCWSVGVGLRLDLEQFPIRLDFATPVVDPDETVDEKVFTFSVGYDF